MWTLALVAEVCRGKGWAARALRPEGVRKALGRLGVGWKRAKHGLTSPDPEYAKKKARDRLIAQAATRPDWVLGFQDECWWTRLAQPDLSTWAVPLDPVRRVPPARVKGDGPAALACYGVLRQDTAGMMLRFVDGRPVSPVTEDFLGWMYGTLAAEGKRVFVRVWDNAAWHVSKRVRRWIARHNRRVRKAGGCRIRVCRLPIKAPWLNPIEPEWMHGERAIVEPDRKLTPDGVRDRVFAHFGTKLTDPLKQVVG